MKSNLSKLYICYHIIDKLYSSFICKGAENTPQLCDIMVLHQTFVFNKEENVRL